MYRPFVQQEGLWLPEGALAESHANQVRQAMEREDEPEVITGPFDKLGRFLNFGYWATIPAPRTRADWLRRADESSS